MTTNEIEKQLINKSKSQIRTHAEDIVSKLQEFGKSQTNFNTNGLEWHHTKDNYKYTDWEELTRLIVMSMERKWLDDMVELKSKELLTKLDLLS